MKNGAGNSKSTPNKSSYHISRRIRTSSRRARVGEGNGSGRGRVQSLQLESIWPKLTRLKLARHQSPRQLRRHRAPQHNEPNYNAEEGGGEAGARSSTVAAAVKT